VGLLQALKPPRIRRLPEAEWDATVGVFRAQVNSGERVRPRAPDGVPRWRVPFWAK